MLSILKKIFTPPDFSTEYFPDMGKIVYYICFVIFIGILNPMTVNFQQIWNGTIPVLSSSVAYIVEMIVLITAFILNQRLHTLRAAALLSFSFVFFIPPLVYSSSMTVHDVAMLTYGASFILSAVFLNRNVYILFSICQLTTIAILFALEFEKPNLLIYTLEQLQSDLVDTIIVNGIIAIGAFILANNMKKGFQRATQTGASFRDNQQRLDSIINTTPSGIILFDIDGNITFANRIGQEIFELPTSVELGIYAPSQILVLYSQDGERIAYEDYPFKKVQKTGQSIFRKNYRIAFPDGRYKILSMNIAPLFGKDSSLSGSVASFNDVTEQSKAEQELLMRREQISSITSNLHSVIYRVRLEKGKMIKPLFISDGAKELFGFSADELMGDIRKFMSSIYRIDAMKDISTLRELIEQPKPFDYEYRVITKTGELRWQRNSGTPFTMADGSVLVDGFVLDITERKHIEQQLQMLGQAVNNSSEVMFMTDMTEKIIFINPQFTALYGYTSDEVIGKVTPKILEHIPNSVVTNELLWQQLEELKIVTTTFVNKSKSGLEIEVESSITPITDKNGKLEGYLSIQRDITERRRIEEAIQQSKKMESLSILAGGVAHEFNNLLTTILGRATVQLKKTEFGSSVHSAFLKIEQAALRAADLTKQLTAYSGRSKFEIRVVNMNDIIKENLHSLIVSTSVPVQIHPDLAAGLFPVRADIRQMKQLIINIITNAIEAVTEKDHTINVRTLNRTIDQSHIQEWVNISKTNMIAGDYVILEVEDRGTGMTEEISQKMFDPFFTTKFTGRGLGLSAVLGILQGHKGGIVVQSVLGEGTLIKIALPAYHSNKDNEQTAPTESRNPAILTIDDDIMNLELVRDIFESDGGEVFCSSNSKEALLLFKEHKDKIDFIILDVNIPGSSCKETIFRLREINKQIPIVLTSGLPSNSIEDFSVMAVDDFLQKPYSSAALLGLVKKYSKRR